MAEAEAIKVLLKANKAIKLLNFPIASNQLYVYIVDTEARGKQMYGMMQRQTKVDYCATIRFSNGASQWVYIRETIGAKASYAKIAKHYDGIGKIESFRSNEKLTQYDIEHISFETPGLQNNIWFGV